MSNRVAKYAGSVAKGNIFIFTDLFIVKDLGKGGEPKWPFCAPGPLGIIIRLLLHKTNSTVVRLYNDLSSLHLSRAIPYRM